MTDLNNHMTVKRRKTRTILIALILFIGGACVVYSSNASTTQPGSVDDPLVTRSYVDSKINELKELIEDLRQEISVGSVQDSGDNDEAVQSSVNMDEVQTYIDKNTMDTDELQQYIDENTVTMEEMKQYISTELDGTEVLIENNETSSNNKTETGASFIVLEMQEGSVLSCEESSEVILRAGDAIAIGNTSGDGLSDVTTGLDIKDGQTIEKNHLLIIPRSDGRGLKFVSKSFIMVKGSYSIH